jgi:hypothetical protein
MVLEPYAWGSYLDELVINPDSTAKRNSGEEGDSDRDSGSDPGSDWTCIASSDGSDSKSSTREES